MASHPESEDTTLSTILSMQCDCRAMPAQQQIALNAMWQRPVGTQSSDKCSLSCTALIAKLSQHKLSVSRGVFVEGEGEGGGG